MYKFKGTVSQVSVVANGPLVWNFESFNLSRPFEEMCNQVEMINMHIFHWWKSFLSSKIFQVCLFFDLKRDFHFKCRNARVIIKLYQYTCFIPVNYINLKTVFIHNVHTFDLFDCRSTRGSQKWCPAERYSIECSKNFQMYTVKIFTDWTRSETFPLLCSILF